MNKTINFKDLSQLAKQHGLSILAVSPVNNALSEIDRLKSWQKNDYAADMTFMQYDPELYCNPQKLLENVKSLIIFSVGYSKKKLAKTKPGYARVARYALGKDYHKVIKRRLKKLMQSLQTDFSLDINYRIFNDAVPLLERYYAQQSGLGFIGKNTMLIQPGLGSFSFIAEILSDLEVSESKVKIIDNDCGTCERCITNCPTQAFEDEYQLNANKCISYLTIEKRGLLNEWERKAIGDWIFGCDICQEVCPFNHKSLKQDTEPDLDEFNDCIVPEGQVNLSEILNLRSDKDFLDRFQSSPIMRTKRQGLLRNACIVASNTKTYSVIPDLEQCLQEEKDEVIKEHARIALEDLSKLTSAS